MSTLQLYIPPLADLTQQEDTVTYYLSDKRLPIQSEKILDQKFHIKYFFLATPYDRMGWNNLTIPKPDTILTNDIHNVSEEAFSQFTIKTYYDKFSEHQDHNDRRQFLKTIPQYFKEKIFGAAFYKDENLVGLIITHQYTIHPATQTSTLHIGYWGYDKDEVRIEEARWIKAEWFRLLAKWSQVCGDIPIDASIDWFNDPALHMVTKKGFKQACLRLDKRATGA